MNLVDALLLLVVILSIWVSIRRGFLVSSLELMAWLGSLFFSFLLYPFVGEFFQKYITALGVWAMPLAFLLMIFITRLLFGRLADTLLDKAPPHWHNHTINNALGFIPGLVNGLIWAALLATFLQLVPVSATLSDKAQDSKVAESLVSKVSWLETKLTPIFSQAINVPKMTGEVAADEPIKLPYTVKRFKPRPDLEAEMLAMVNKERTDRGLNALKPDPDAVPVARAHSGDMFTRGYFSHISPEGENPFDRMRKGGLIFLTAGENLALAQTLPMAHTGLMNSPGHRANILNPSYGRLGIGILDGGIYGLMITQNFRN